MKLQFDAEKAAQQFQKFNSLYKTAKETLSVAENNLVTNEIPDVWQEHFSEIISKMNTSKRESDHSQKIHSLKTSEYQMAKNNLQKLEKELHKHIVKSE